MTTSTTTLVGRDEFTADPLRFGVGARVTVAVMCDDYVDVILGALAGLDTRGLTIETGDVSTFAGGSEADLLGWLTDLADAVAATGHHAALSVQLSRGCPGEVVCELPGGAGPRVVDTPKGRQIGRHASAEWAIYPLADDVRGGVEPDHMRDIEAAIQLSRELGTFRGSAHFVTRLEGDLGAIIETVVAGWTMVGRSVQHVVAHLSISVNSPSHSNAAA
ncbi:Ykof family thiamine-binding protein [Tessaracoccus sp. OS52]|uniref:Ykof family thiamine-binding protein n=1 Tax=Tessaracoccus sp. OS52 TaxID=2886691 RepID=UPI001D125B0F|nr:Ykof family thiamine-binding protein [Tessaracoccus sp. OS52]MCC2592027.1 Ykof family thiamine-binding protein [Tessaracoccus sp. OS52]